MPAVGVTDQGAEDLTVILDGQQDDGVCQHVVAVVEVLSGVQQFVLHFSLSVFFEGRVRGFFLFYGVSLTRCNGI